MELRNKTVNVAVQVLPMSDNHDMYDLVDAAIKVIENSGLKYKVTPFETVIEGSYGDVMALVEKVQEACFISGAQKLLCNLKIQSDHTGHVTIADKMAKYE
ncbi:thiamine-binding protein [Carboxylicivirga sediminis]|uniref:Thiamine-binding protein n=1 Tax=Carboxylicivirga sediminis TaxID=2006564 RepID=A0A941F7F1_9BACT|nr:thiamine-binding protein [Carboxylicivirga sediminis]MBR8538316.1 thiamine-binding protein [Carboxylicivirga sediminis]